MASGTKKGCCVSAALFFLAPPGIESRFEADHPWGGLGHAELSPSTNLYILLFSDYSVY